MLGLGFGLLFLNIIGYYKTLRNDDIYSEPKNVFENDITLTAEEFYQEIKRGEEESTEEYVIRLNNTVNQGIAHYWWDEGIEKYNLSIPIYDNYLFYFSKYLFPKFYQEKHEFTSYKKAVERGVGLCSQHAVIISEILKENGVNSKILRLTGHVVAIAEIDEKNSNWWILDADFGVVINQNIEKIEASTEVIRSYYRGKADAETLDYLVEVYGKKGNSTCIDAVEYHLYSPANRVESLFYTLKWIIPMVLIGTYFMLTLTKH